ncbi:LacI family DNA-binding transcriptional regulator [Rhizobium bangladeshense]|uniref:LacI family DNA-binding transcriptional regulator n=1 Tax=Rhizobium bangladeshense TaxID=1138189 RepID=UPI001C83B492|nr:LacI family DNA-binding transcriptional regulator [Rhizobium bangladeshense]MBX4871107.1 LacI family DNA-binding transcriptional regulator [Rhizobium bangladeshense]
MVTIKDIALHAGVSDQTVSRVVRNDKRVDERTRARVSEAIDRLGYVPNRAALMMRQNKSGIIGVMTDVISTTPDSTEIIRGIQSAVEGAGYSMLMVNTGGDLERTRQSWRELKGHRVDGVIYGTMFQRELGPDELDPEVKTVLVNCHEPPDVEVPKIVPGEPDGMREAIDAAIANGHRDFGYVRLNPLIMAADIREAALRQRLSEHGLALRDDWCISGVTGPIFGDRFVAFDNARALLATSERPSILFCGNDEIALQVFCASSSLGIRIPGELSIVGFDDFKVVAEVMRPSLTTVALPYFEMGQAAVAALASIIANEPVPSVLSVACKLIQRQSVGKVMR